MWCGQHSYPSKVLEKVKFLPVLDDDDDTEFLEGHTNLPECGKKSISTLRKICFSPQRVMHIYLFLELMGLSIFFNLLTEFLISFIIKNYLN